MGCIYLYPDVISLESYTGSLDSGESDSLTVTIDASTLEFGFYSYEITVTENDSIFHTIPVEIEVYPIYLPAPENILISIGQNSILLQWEAVAGAQGYKIYRSLQPDTAFSEIGTTSLTTFTDSEGDDRSFYRIISYYTGSAIRRDLHE